MALRDQPYLPLYVQDFMTDEKLMECSAAATGVYIRLMCAMHKTDEYGKILLKQKDKQTDNQVKNFAYKIGKQMPFPHDIILAGLTELLEENVLKIDGDYLLQGRMVADNALSLTRSKSGKIGGDSNASNLLKQKVKQNTKVAKPKSKANTENEYEIENVIVVSNDKWPSLLEFIEYAKTLPPYKPELNFALESKYNTWSETKKDGHGKKIVNWKNTLRNTILYLKPTSNNNGSPTTGTDANIEASKRILDDFNQKLSGRTMDKDA